MVTDNLNRKRLAELVGQLREDDHLWQAAIDIAIELDDGFQDCDRLLIAIVSAINTRFGWN